MTGENNEENDEKLEIGSVVRLKENAETYMMIYVIWKDNGSKKWFPVPIGEGPTWPASEAVKKRFRFGLREVDVQAVDGTVRVSYKDNVTDGRNVR